MNRINSLLKSRITRNTAWIVGGKVIHMLIALFVGVLSAKFLGPSNYGLINYAAAYTSFFASICTLGINSVIVKFFVDAPKESGETLGTALMLRGASSFLSMLTICLISFFIDKDEPLTLAVVALCSIGLIFQIFDTFKYWFQYRLESKYSSIAQTLAYLFVSVYKIIILIICKDVRWFAVATSVEYAALALLLFTLYKLKGGQRLSFSPRRAWALLGKSRHYILSGLMVAVYGFTDRFMLKQMMTEGDVGCYSAALSVCNMWVFLLAAIIDSFSPEIMSLYGKDREAFERRNRQLYAIVFYVSLIASLLIALLAEPLVSILYGADYAQASAPLRVISWYVAFSYLGVARNAWIVCEDKQRHLIWLYLGAAMTNIILNLVFIPFLGTVGAALASLITQISTVFVFPWLLPDLRKNAVLMLEAVLFKKLK